MNETQKGFVQLHLSVLLAGFTGLFGRLITLNEVDIVWYRMLFTSLILLVFTGLPRVGWRKFLQLCGCGALLGFHWILFYGSIKASNVSIGVICFSLIGFFTAVSLSMPVIVMVLPLAWCLPPSAPFMPFATRRRVWAYAAG